MRCEALTVTFGELRALDGLTLQVESGARLGLIGPNGSGKTTLFNAVTGLVPVKSGTIRIDGQDVTKKGVRGRFKRGVARTFQRARLCDELSVVDNVLIGMRTGYEEGLLKNVFRRGMMRGRWKQDIERAQELLIGFKRSLGAKIYQRVGSLSALDRRRIEVCRALMADPSLLLLDEPSAGMTHDEMAELMDDIIAMHGQRLAMSIILVEHEMQAIARVAERCVVMNYGKKIAEGEYKTIITDKWVREAYLGEE